MQAEHERAEVVSRGAQRGQMLGPGDKQMAERRVNCVVECPHGEKIAAVYEKVVTGNGDLPLPERVRKLEDEMEGVLPDLKKLVAASERAEGARESDKEFHNKRDEEIKKALGITTRHMNRWMLAIAMMTLIAAILGLFHR